MAFLQFWNIKLVPSSKKHTAESSPTPIQDNTTTAEQTIEDKSGNADSQTQLSQSSSGSSTQLTDWTIQESKETAITLREKQKHVEAQVYRIWTVLSTFEESSAACISEMLRHVSNGHYFDGVRMAEKFVLHVETLFAAIDDLNAAFRHLGSKGKEKHRTFLINISFLMLDNFPCYTFYRNPACSRSSDAMQEGREFLFTPVAHA